MSWLRKECGRALIVLLNLTAFSLAAVSARADQNYSQQVCFDNSLSPQDYF